MKNQKGITLIALVMTVILMMILAGVVVTGIVNKGLFNNAVLAVKKSEIFSIIESVESKGLLVGKKNLNGKLSEVIKKDYTKYDSIFKVVNGELVYTGDNPKIVGYLLELGKGEESIENGGAICAVKGHNFRDANYLDPKTCTRCGHTEGEKLAATEPHLDQQNSEDIGIGTDGQLVNLDNWTYEKISGTWKLTGYTGTYSEQGEIEGKVPQVINNINVTSMASTFNGNTNLKIAPEIPTTVQSMDSTFKGCTALTKAPLIPYGVTCVNNTFNGCTSLVALPVGFTLPDSITGRNIIGTFSGCTSLKELPDSFRISKNTISILSVFSGCISLEKLPDDFTIPDNVTEIMYAFQNCSALKKLPDSFRLPPRATSGGFMFKSAGITELPEGFTIPEGYTTLISMFQDCRSLESLPNSFTIPSTMQNMTQTFQQCTKLMSLPERFSFPTGIQTLTYTFYGCSGLTNIPENLTLPSTLDNMYWTFRGCAKLEGAIIIDGAPSNVNGCITNVATSGNGLTVKYTEKCTNIDAIMATVSAGANITFEQITLESSAKKR